MADDPVTGKLDSILATASRWSTPPSPAVMAHLQNLMQVYALYTDEGRGQELARLFTADATWDGTELGYGVASGPEEIAATVLQHFQPARPMLHVPGPLLAVEIADGEARGVSWCLATRESGSGAGPLIYFHYHDGFRRDAAGGWHFSRRVLRLRFRAGA
jgi:hypothetical protein